MSSPSFQSAKIYDEDYERAKAMRSDRGLGISESIGCALEGWDKLSKKEQDEIVRSRAKRRHEEPVAAA